ncbi:MAG: VOC family protein, partial [Serratia marcescens]|nr:VOC family protein [Serratia marcescens]
MGIKRLNHAVLYVSDVRQSADFYHQVLGFKLKPSDSPDRAVFTQAADSDNDHDLALFSKNLGQQRAGVFRANNEPPAEHDDKAPVNPKSIEVETIKTTGDFPAKVALHPEITA